MVPHENHPTMIAVFRTRWFILHDKCSDHPCIDIVILIRIRAHRTYSQGTAFVPNLKCRICPIVKGRPLTCARRSCKVVV